VFVIEREFAKAAVFSLVAAALTFFGFIHGEAIGVGQTPLVAISYLGVAIILFGCAKYAAVTPKPAESAGHEQLHPASSSAT